MIVGAGIDIVEIPRMRDAVRRWGKDFLAKVFTAREIAYANARPIPHQHFAARFAAKEAVIKAVGEPRTSPMKWTDIEVFNDAEGKPILKFHDTALRLKKRKRISDVIVSMSHSKNYAIASVILLGKGR